MLLQKQIDYPFSLLCEKQCINVYFQTPYTKRVSAYKTWLGGEQHERVLA